MIAAQQIFIILKEDFDVSANVEDIDEGLCIKVKPDTAPIADRLQRFVQVMRGDQHHGWPEFSNPGHDLMDIHILSALL
jgi:hypothetical protein